jgi:hypothetical protein
MSGSVVSLARRRWQGTHTIDPWGLDRELVSLVEPLASLRWDIRVDGADLLGARGPALLVFNRRFGVTEPLVLAAGIHRATGRDVRLVGCPDVAPLATMLRRFGAVVAVPDEVAGLLRAGEVVAVAADRAPLRRSRAGAAPLALLEPALGLDVPVLPVAVRGRELGRRWQVSVGEPLPTPGGPAPLAEADLADHARRGLQDLLDCG